MKWGNVKAGDVYKTRLTFVPPGDDVWVVLEIGPCPENDGFVRVRYVYLHNMDEHLSISEFSVPEQDSVDYDPMFDA